MAHRHPEPNSTRITSPTGTTHRLVVAATPCGLTAGETASMPRSPGTTTVPPNACKRCFREA